MSKQWLDEKIWEVCKKAEIWWAERIPSIYECSEKTIEQWREEEEHKKRWKELVV